MIGEPRPSPKSQAESANGTGGSGGNVNLKKVGSVQRLKAATREQIAKVPDFGGKAAEELKSFLEARTI